MAAKKNTAAVDTYDWGAYEGETGFENTSTKDLGTPFLTVLQKSSPEVDKTHPNFPEKKIEGAEAGCVVNTLSREVVYSPEGEPIKVIPCGHLTLYVEWKPRESGGGIVGAHSDPRVLGGTSKNDKGIPVLPNGNTIIETSHFFVKLKQEDDWVPAVIALSSTQLKKSRFWLNLMMGLKANGKNVPMFAKQYLLTTKVESNEKGSWYGWGIESGEWNSDGGLIAECRQIAQECASGQAPIAQIGGGSADADTEVI